MGRLGEILQGLEEGAVRVTKTACTAGDKPEPEAKAGGSSITSVRGEVHGPISHEQFEVRHSYQLVKDPIQ